MPAVMTNRSGAGKAALGDDPRLIEVGIGIPLAKKRALQPIHPITMPSDLLEQAARAAGMFQRSAIILTGGCALRLMLCRSLKSWPQWDSFRIPASQ